MAIGIALFLSACSLVPLGPDKSGPQIKPLDPFRSPNLRTEQGAERPERPQEPRADAQPEDVTNRAKAQRLWQTPPSLSPIRSTIKPGPKSVAAPSASEDKTEAAVNLENMPLPAFASTIYATILKRNITIDAAIQKRTDLVSLKTGVPVTGVQLSATAASVLRSYGVVVLEHDGLVRLVPENSPATGSIELIRSRSQPDVPSRLRPLFQLYELTQANASTASQWVRTLFQGRVTVSDDLSRNAVLLSGQSDAVAAAIEALEVLDQPYLRGRYSARINPAFWSAQDMVARLTELMAAQGIYAGSSANLSAPLLLIPVPQVNSVIVFGASSEMVDHALRWAQELDQTPNVRRNGRYITYNVRNTDARLLANTLQQLLGGASTPGAPAAPGAPGLPGAAAPSPAAQPGAAATAGGSRVVVNAAANSIIMQGNPDEFAQIRDLLVELDRPPRSALIMATVAEVNLTDTEQFGFNWLLNQFSLSGLRINGNIGGSSTNISGGAGVNLGIANVSGDPRAVLTALATSNRVKVLSNPSIVALNGESASIQVGQDVPVLTSQISSTSGANFTGGQNLLQSVQYRNVGIILNVTPVIYSGGRLQLKVTQEVSGVASGSAGVGSSPIFTTRKIDTRFSANDGQSTLIGGLIREQRDGGNSGVPYAKDIPILGTLFRTGTSGNFTRTELVILLTAYVMEDDTDAQALTHAFRNQFDWARQLDNTGTTIKAPRKTVSVDKRPDDLLPAALQPEGSKSSAASQNETVKSQSLPPQAMEPQADPQGRKPYVIGPPVIRAEPVAPPAPTAPLPAPATLAAPPAGAAAAPTKTPDAMTNAVPTPRSSPPVGVVPMGKPVTDSSLLKELQDAVKSR